MDRHSSRPGPRILVTGATGMVGSAVTAQLHDLRIDVRTTSRSDLAEPAHTVWDLAEQQAPDELVLWDPDVIVHAAAFTDVDAAERDPLACERVNVTGTRAVADLAATCSARLVHLSTDSVFDGRTGGYRDCDIPEPINVYARTKRQAEIIALATPGALVLRFNVIGQRGLARWILESAWRGSQIDVYRDSVFSPLVADDLAAYLARLAVCDVQGVVHLAADKVISKAELAQRLVTAAGLQGRARLRETDQPESASDGRAPRPRRTWLVHSDRIRSIVPPAPLEAAVQKLAHQFKTTRVG